MEKMQGQPLSVPLEAFTLPGSAGSVYSPQRKFANLTRKKMVGALSLPVF